MKNVLKRGVKFDIGFCQDCDIENPEMGNDDMSKANISLMICALGTFTY